MGRIAQAAQSLQSRGLDAFRSLDIFRCLLDGFRRLQRARCFCDFRPQPQLAQKPPSCHFSASGNGFLDQTEFYRFLVACDGRALSLASLSIA